MADKSIKITISSALNASGFTAARRVMTNFVSGTVDFAKRVGGNLMNIKAGFDMVYGSVSKLAGFAKTALKEAFKFEKSHTDFTGLLNSVDAAKKHIEDLRKFASSTPLTFDDLSRASKLLLSFGMDVKDVMPSMQMLGDIAMGDSQKFQGLALVFAQVKSAGKLMGQDLLQMINQGFNPLTVIAKETGKSVSELKDIMSKGGITFEIVQEAMKKATSEGGLFNNAMKNAATTGEGLVSTLGDKWADAVRTFGNAFSDAAKGGLSELIDKITELTNDGSIERWASKSYDAFTTVVGASKRAANAIQDMLGLGERNTQGEIMSALGGIGAGLSQGSEYGGGWRGFRKAQAAYLALHSSNKDVADQNAKNLSDMMNEDGEWKGYVDIRKVAAEDDAEERRQEAEMARERAKKSKEEKDRAEKEKASSQNQSQKSMSEMLAEGNAAATAKLEAEKRAEIEKTMAKLREMAGIDSDVDVAVNVEEPKPFKIDVEEPDEVKVKVEEPKPVDVKVNQPDPIKVDVERPEDVKIGVIEPDEVNVKVDNPPPVDVKVNQPDPVDVKVNQPDPVDVKVVKPDAVSVDVKKPDAVKIDVEKPEPVTVKANVAIDDDGFAALENRMKTIPELIKPDMSGVKKALAELASARTEEELKAAKAAVDTAMKKQKAEDESFKRAQERARESDRNATEFVNAYEKDKEETSKKAAKAELEANRDAMKKLHDARKKQLDDEEEKVKKQIDDAKAKGFDNVMATAGGGAWDNGTLNQAEEIQSEHQKKVGEQRAAKAEENLKKKMEKLGATLDDPSKLGRMSNLERAAFERMKLKEAEAKAAKIQKEKEDREKQIVNDLDAIKKKLQDVGL